MLLQFKGENDGENLYCTIQILALRREKKAEALRIALPLKKVTVRKGFVEESYPQSKSGNGNEQSGSRVTQNAKHRDPGKKCEATCYYRCPSRKQNEFREQAKGEADAIYAKMGSRSEGLLRFWPSKRRLQASWSRAAVGNPYQSLQLLLIEKLPELVTNSSGGSKNIKIDKITVWGTLETTKGVTVQPQTFGQGWWRTVPPPTTCQYGQDESAKLLKGW